MLPSSFCCDAQKMRAKDRVRVDDFFTPLWRLTYRQQLTAGHAARKTMLRWRASV